MSAPSDSPPFEFGCSTLPFAEPYYWILTRHGRHLEALLRGTALPWSREAGLIRALTEEYFIRCIRENADADSHQCLEAEAWRQLIERREFERRNPPPKPNRTWVRAWEIRPGMILFPEGRPVLLVNPAATSELRARGGPVSYRNAPDLPWHDGRQRWHLAADLTTRARKEFTFDEKALHEAADGLGRVMTYVWRDGPDDDMSILDADTNATYHFPPDRVSGDIHAPGGLHGYESVRVQWWEGEPVWVWGLA